MRWTRSPVLLAAVVVVDVLVVVVAYLLMHREADPLVSSAPAGSGQSSAPDPLDRAAPIEGPLFLASASQGSLLRVTRGSCDDRFLSTARVWIAPTYRAPLREATVPGLQEALGGVVNGRYATLVGTERDCSLAGWRTSDAGVTWRKGAVPKDVWYLDPDTTMAGIHGPLAGGDLNLDCTPASVTTIEGGRKALVSCNDYNVLEVSASADVPPVTYIVSDPAGAALPGSGMPQVLAATDKCGAAVLRITSQQDAKPLVCLGDGGAPLGFAIGGSRVFAQVGYQLFVSSDGGRRFTTYPGESGNAGASASPSATPSG